LLERIANLFRFYPVPDPSEKSVILISAEASMTRERESCLNSVSRMNAKATAWVGSVVSKVSKFQTATQMHEWFGRIDYTTRERVTSVLNMIDNMLGTVKYQLPGEPTITQ